MKRFYFVIVLVFFGVISYSQTQEKKSQDNWSGITLSTLNFIPGEQQLESVLGQGFYSEDNSKSLEFFSGINVEVRVLNQDLKDFLSVSHFGLRVGLNSNFRVGGGIRVDVLNLPDYRLFAILKWRGYLADFIFLSSLDTEILLPSIKDGVEIRPESKNYWGWWIFPSASLVFQQIPRRELGAELKFGFTNQVFFDYSFIEYALKLFYRLGNSQLGLKLSGSSLYLDSVNHMMKPIIGLELKIFEPNIF